MSNFKEPPLADRGPFAGNPRTSYMLASLSNANAGLTKIKCYKIACLPPILLLLRNDRVCPPLQPSAHRLIHAAETAGHHRAHSPRSSSALTNGSSILLMAKSLQRMLSDQKRLVNIRKKKEKRNGRVATRPKHDRQGRVCVPWGGKLTKPRQSARPAPR